MSFTPILPPSHPFLRLARALLHVLGNDHPSQKQINLMHTLLEKTVIEHHLVFDRKLTEREKCCLFLIASGQTTIQIADLLNVKSSTVDTWRKSIKQKLNSNTMAQAVFVGIRYGYVTPETVSPISGRD
jgi:DNA-binding CsgD family transcriptional regulator